MILNPDPRGADVVMNAITYGEEWSARWEQDIGPFRNPNTENASRLLAEYAEGQPVLEFGVGTGRLALALQDLGLKVSGIDNSEWMIKELRKKPGGEGIKITLGDFSTTKVNGSFGLVVLVSHAIMALNTQDAQIACFENAFRHLVKGGYFAVEVLSPHRPGYGDGGLRAVRIEPDELMLHASKLDPLTQQVREIALFVRDGVAPRIRPAASRFVCPGELDLMARIAGFRFRERWGGWDKKPFTSDSAIHVSIYQSH